MPERLFGRNNYVILAALILSALLHVINGMAYAAETQEESVPTLTVAGFEFSGNETISNDTLAGLVHDAVGNELTLTELLEQVDRITRFYREQGFVVARAFLPPQEVANGIVRIEILEGHYGDILIRNDSRLRDEAAIKHLTSLQPGDLITQSALERTTLLLNDLPGVHAETTFLIGETAGTSDLVVSLTDRSPWSASFSVNNIGTHIQSRLSATWNNPLGHGDRLSAGVGSFSDGSRNGNASYSAPIEGGDLRASLSIATSEQRQSLGSSSIVTSGRTTGVRFDYPVVRTRTANQRIGLNLDSWTENRTIGAVLADKSRITRTTVEWQGDTTLAKGGSLTYSLRATRGSLNLSPDDVSIADAASARTAGEFTRFNAGTVIRRPVGDHLTLNLEMRGQVASKNLHSSEKMSVSGLGGVRAYGSGTTSGDQGWIIRIDLHRGFRSPAWELSGTWTVFADIAGVQANRIPWTGAGDKNDFLFAGIGWGLTMVRGNWLLDVTNAYPVGPNPVGGGRGGRLWLRATWQY